MSGENIKKSTKTKRPGYPPEVKDRLRRIHDNVEGIYQNLVKQGMPDTEECRRILYINILLAAHSYYGAGSEDGIDFAKDFLEKTEADIISKTGDGRLISPTKSALEAKITELKKPK